MALYFVTVWPSASECTFFKYPSSWSERIKRFKMAAIIRFDLVISKMTVQGGGCTTVVVQNEIQIHQQNRTNAYLYRQQGIASDTIPSHCTILLTGLIAGWILIS